MIKASRLIKANSVVRLEAAQKLGQALRTIDSIMGSCKFGTGSFVLNFPVSQNLDVFTTMLASVRQDYETEEEYTEALRRDMGLNVSAPSGFIQLGFPAGTYVADALLAGACNFSDCSIGWSESESVDESKSFLYQHVNSGTQFKGLQSVLVVR